MPRPLSRAGFANSTQRELAWWLARGASVEDAAKNVGLPDASRVYAFAKTRDFAHALREGVLDRLSNDLAPKAVSILDEIMRDNAVNARVRVDAAKALLDRAGYPSATPGTAPRGDRLLSEYKPAELQRLVAELEEQRAREANTIDITPTAVTASPTAEDMLA